MLVEKKIRLSSHFGITTVQVVCLDPTDIDELNRTPAVRALNIGDVFLARNETNAILYGVQNKDGKASIVEITGSSGSSPAYEEDPNIKKYKKEKKAVNKKNKSKDKVEVINMDLSIDPYKIKSQLSLLNGLLAQDVLSFSKDEMDAIEGIINLYDYIGDTLVDGHGYDENEIFCLSDIDEAISFDELNEEDD